MAAEIEKAKQKKMVLRYFTENGIREIALEMFEQISDNEDLQDEKF